MNIVIGWPRLQKPIRPQPRGPYKIEYSHGAAVLQISEDGELRRYFLEDFRQAWHPHRLPNLPR